LGSIYWKFNSLDSKMFSIISIGFSSDIGVNSFCCLLTTIKSLLIEEITFSYLLLSRSIATRQWSLVRITSFALRHITLLLTCCMWKLVGITIGRHPETEYNF
jgi:hypothetical protein